MPKNNPTPTPRPAWIDERAVAEMTGISLSTLRNARSLRRGLPFYKLAEARTASVRYKLSDVLQWLESRRIEPGR